MSTVLEIVWLISGLIILVRYPRWSRVSYFNGAQMGGDVDYPYRMGMFFPMMIAGPIGIIFMEWELRRTIRKHPERQVR